MLPPFEHEGNLLRGVPNVSDCFGDLARVRLITYRFQHPGPHQKQGFIKVVSAELGSSRVILGWFRVAWGLLKGNVQGWFSVGLGWA